MDSAFGESVSMADESVLGGCNQHQVDLPSQTLLHRPTHYTTLQCDQPISSSSPSQSFRAQRSLVQWHGGFVSLRVTQVTSFVALVQEVSLVSPRHSSRMTLMYSGPLFWFWRSSRLGSLLRCTRRLYGGLYSLASCTDPVK